MATIIFALAGIQGECFDVTRAKTRNLVENKLKKTSDRVIFIGVPVKKTELWKYQQDEEYNEKFLELIWAKIQTLSRDEKVGIFIAHASYEGVDYADYRKLFFPFSVIFNFSAFPINDLRKKYLNEEANRSSSSIEKKVMGLLPALGILKHELISNRNKTACLLPLRNFKSLNFKNFVCNLYHMLSSESISNEAVSGLIGEYKKKFPLRQLDPNSNLSSHVDDRDLIFCAPGKALHGYPQHNKNDAHDYRCLLNAVSRFGIGYERSYHYDCKFANQAVAGKFENCHNVGDTLSGKQHTHVNISPNDFIRK